MKVLLVDDHPLFLEGLAKLVEEVGFTVVGTAADGFEALEKARALKPDLILMDIQMPRCDGLTATRLIKAERPEIRVVMLTVAEDDELLFTAIRYGASGYLLKTLEASRFKDLLAGLMRGEAPLAPGLSSRILHEFARLAEGGQATSASVKESPAPAPMNLTPRQLQILSLVAQGLTYREVGGLLSLSERTVKYHMAEILKELKLENRAQAVAWARRKGFGNINQGELH